MVERGPWEAEIPPEVPAAAPFPCSSSPAPTMQPSTRSATSRSGACRPSEPSSPATGHTVQRHPVSTRCSPSSSSSPQRATLPRSICNEGVPRKTVPQRRTWVSLALLLAGLGLLAASFAPLGSSGEVRRGGMLRFVYIENGLGPDPQAADYRMLNATQLTLYAFPDVEGATRIIPPPPRVCPSSRGTAGRTRLRSGPASGSATVRARYGAELRRCLQPALQPEARFRRHVPVRRRRRRPRHAGRQGHDRVRRGRDGGQPASGWSRRGPISWCG